jgi:diaminopimelate epimerase
MKAQFFKYQAMGNDMIVIDPNYFDFQLTPAIVRLICHRHLGLGADGICYGPFPSPDHPLTLRFFNPDGSEAEKSGNGLRIFARYLWDQRYVSTPQFMLWMNGQQIEAELKDDSAQRLSMSLGRLSFSSLDIPVSGGAREVVGEIMAFGEHVYPVTAVTIGNPHCVVFMDEISASLVQSLGPLIETAPYFPQRTNVQLAQVLDEHNLRIEIWERGAGYTLASGTSASATAGAALKTGRCASPVEVHMAGGVAQVSIDSTWSVTLTGSVEAVCKGTFAPELVARFLGEAS